jgi:hypothetical protein
MHAALMTTSTNKMMIPPAGSFGRVLRRTDRDADFLAGQVRFTSYDVTIKARAVDHPDGVRALTLFFPKDRDSSVIRAVRAGWRDVTDLWSDHMTERPSTLAELTALEWPDMQALAEEHGVRTNGVKRETIASTLADKLGIPTE